jgi:hypothetical protein
MGNRGIFPLILNFGIRWSLVVNFMPHCVILGNGHFYPLNRMPCLDILEKKKNSCCYLVLNPGLSSLYPSHCTAYAARTLCVLNCLLLYFGQSPEKLFWSLMLSAFMEVERNVGCDLMCYRGCFVWSFYGGEV